MPFPAFAYTAYVDGAGRLYLCNDVEAVTWANGEGSPAVKEGVGVFNWYTFSVCFAGENPNEAQIATLTRARIAADWVIDRPLQVKGHRDVSPTACPGADVDRWLPSVAA